MHKLSRPVNKITSVPYIKDDLTAGYALDELLPYVVPFRISLFDHCPGESWHGNVHRPVAYTSPQCGCVSCMCSATSLDFEVTQVKVVTDESRAASMSRSANEESDVQLLRPPWPKMRAFAQLMHLSCRYFLI